HARGQVDDARPAGLFAGLVFVEDPQAVFQVDVLGGDAGDLGGPAAGRLQGEDEVPELLVLDGREDLLPLGLREDAVAAPGGRLADLLDRVGSQDPLGLGPVAGPLDGGDGAAAGGVVPAVVAVEPARDVEGLDLRGADAAVEVAEVLQEVLVPAE